MPDLRDGLEVHVTKFPIVRAHDWAYIPLMEITFTIPDELATGLAEDSVDLGRLALESVAVEGYRSGRLSAFQVRQLLGHGSRWETEDFLAAHEVWPGTTAADLAEEFRSLENLRPA
jgi:hypothetical protein